MKKTKLFFAWFSCHQWEAGDENAVPGAQTPSEPEQCFMPTD